MGAVTDGPEERLTPQEPLQENDAVVVQPGISHALQDWESLNRSVRLRDTLGIVLLTVVADVCLYDHPGGSGAAILVLATLLGLLLAAPGRLRFVHSLLPLTLVLTACMVAWNCSWLLSSVAVISTLAFAIKLFRPEWSITEVAWAAPLALLRAPWRLLEHCLHPLGHRVTSEAGTADKKTRIHLRVIFIPLSIVTLFFLIFIAANPVLEKVSTDITQRLGELLEPFFDIFSLPRVLSWVGWLLVFALLLRPLYPSAVTDWLHQREETLSPPADAASDGVEFMTALATFVCVNALFLAFNVMDAVYLYFKATLPEGISWAQYVHRGCSWLTLALVLSTMVIGVIFGRRLTFHPRSRTLRVWSYLWAAQNVVLTMGALRRLQMYIDYNGLTRLRLVGLYGILLVLVGLGVMVWKVGRSRNFLWIVRRYLLALWTTIVVLALTPRDLVCWRYNVDHVMRGNSRPLALLTVQEMSPESYPPLIRLLDHPEPWIREGIAAFLGRCTERLISENPQSWTRWQGAQAWACRRLKATGKRIESIVPRSQWIEVEDRFLDHVRPWVHSRVLLLYD